MVEPRPISHQIDMPIHVMNKTNIFHSFIIHGMYTMSIRLKVKKYPYNLQSMTSIMMLWTLSFMEYVTIYDMINMSANVLKTSNCSKWIFSWYHSKASFINTSKTEQKGQLFADDIFIYIFLNKNCYDFIQISLKSPPECPADNISSLV